MSTQPFLLQQLKPEGGGSVLAKAAQSIALQTGDIATVVDVLRGRAFRYYAEGLRQYLAIRTGSMERSEQLLARLRAYATATDSSALVEAPGIRGRLYQAARAAIRTGSRSFEPPTDQARRELPWRAAASSHAAVDPLYALRFELGEEDAELLELRYARELSIDELAFVYGLGADAVEDRLATASARAQLLLEDHGISDERRLGRLVLEAFALQNQPSSAEDVETVEALPAGTVIGGRYAIETRFGSGAFGDVYRAKDTEVPGHTVALKLIHQAAYSETAKQASLRELRVIASVFHPSVVQFKDHGWFEGRLWFVMPWYDGETLESRLRRGPLSRAEAQRIFQPLARALAAMHAAGVRHQDIKPDNIFLARLPGFADEEILPVLLDLGVAATEAEMVVAGTPTYFAPEVAAQFSSVEEKKPVTEKADVFALALSLRNALEPETQDEVMGGAVEAFIESRSRDVPEPPSGRKLRFMTPAFSRWLHADATERPTAESLAEELTLLTRPEERRKRTLGILRWALPLVAALLAATAAVVFVFHRQATMQRAEAERARLDASDLRQDLAFTKEATERLQEQYRQSQLTRDQLSNRLTRTENQLGTTRKELQDLDKRLTKTRADLKTSQETGAALQERLTETTERLGRQRVRAEKLDAQLANANLALEQEQRRVLSMRGELGSMKAQVRAEAARSKELEASVAQQTEARARAEREIEALEAELAELRRQSLDEPTGNEEAVGDTLSGDNGV